jgi:hypothetical protein
MNSVLFPIKQTEETMTCQNGLWSLPYLTDRRDHDTFNVRMNSVLFPIKQYNQGYDQRHIILYASDMNGLSKARS